MRSADTELCTLVQMGDFRAAGAWLVEHHAHEVLGLLRAMVRDASTAEDLAQDVFSSAFASLPGWRGEASSRTWLLTIARNRCIDHLRALRRAPFSDSGGDPDAHPDDAPLPGDLLARRAEVDGALAELDEGDRALVVLRYRHGMSYEEIAAVFGLKEGTVRMRMSRALARMRRALESAPRTVSAYAGAVLRAVPMDVGGTDHELDETRAAREKSEPVDGDELAAEEPVPAVPAQAVPPPSFAGAPPPRPHAPRPAPASPPMAHGGAPPAAAPAAPKGGLLDRVGRVLD